jgi:DNA-binding transcriptional MerR regulator
MAAPKSGALPDKLYFKIGEVSEIIGVEPYVLRYWETEFPALKPSKSRSQQRMYRKRDVELLIEIKRLLYDEMYTIAGAKKQLGKSGERTLSSQMYLKLPEPRDSETLRKVENELHDLMKAIEG